MPGGNADPAMSRAGSSFACCSGKAAEALGNGASCSTEPVPRVVHRLADGRVVNDVPLEAYLYSVVPLEMSPGWPWAHSGTSHLRGNVRVQRRIRAAITISSSEADQVYGGNAASPIGSAPP